MYLFKNKDGSLVQAPDDFDQQNPGWDELKDVEEVLFVSKVLIPHIKLVPKPAGTGKDKDKPETGARRPGKK